jgi:anti-sigma factor (TIGR02949 family)
VSECDAFRRLISPFLDGELVGEDRAAFERHVDSCAACRASLAQERAVVKLVAEALPLYQAPPALRERIAGLLGVYQRRRGGPGWRMAAAVAAAALLAGSLWLAPRPRSAPASTPAASELSALAARTHQRYAAGQLPLEIASERADEVSGWFAGRVPFQLALPDYPVGSAGRKPYRLAGGRLLAFKNDAAAFVAYRMEERPISLLVTSADLVRPAGGEVVASGGLRFHVESLNGLKVITWTHKGLTYALASDLDVEASQSCRVCHGDASERRKLESLSLRPPGRAAQRPHRH